MMSQTMPVDLRGTRPPDHLKPKTLLSKSTGDLHAANTQHTEDDHIHVGMPVKHVKERRANPEQRKREKEAQIQAAKEFQPSGDGMLFGNISSEALRRLNAMIANFFMMKDGTISKEINLSRYGIDCGTTITDSVVQELCTIQPHLTSLDLSNCVEVSDAGLWAIARHCKHLQTLTLAGCDKITHNGLRSLAFAGDTITALDFNHCHKLDDFALTVISSGMDDTFLFIDLGNFMAFCCQVNGYYRSCRCGTAPVLLIQVLESLRSVCHECGFVATFKAVDDCVIAR
jgi:hypothetical protein